MGYGDLGCYGQRLIQTPCIDRMAAEGMRFTDAYAGCPVSAPLKTLYPDKFAELIGIVHREHTDSPLFPIIIPE